MTPTATPFLRPTDAPRPSTENSHRHLRMRTCVDGIFHNFGTVLLLPIRDTLGYVTRRLPSGGGGHVGCGQGVYGV